MAKTSGNNRSSNSSTDRRTPAEKAKPYAATMTIEHNGEVKHITRRFTTEATANKWNNEMENKLLFRKDYTLQAASVEKTLKNGRVEDVSFIDLAKVLYGEKAYRNKTGYFSKR